MYYIQLPNWWTLEAYFLLITPKWNSYCRKSKRSFRNNPLKLHSLFNAYNGCLCVLDLITAFFLLIKRLCSFTYDLYARIDLWRRVGVNWANLHRKQAENEIFQVVFLILKANAENNYEEDAFEYRNEKCTISREI